MGRTTRRIPVKGTTTSTANLWPEFYEPGVDDVRPRSAAIVACRIIALFLGVEAFIALVSFLLIVRGLSGTSTFWAYVGTRLVVAYLLWIIAERLGEVMARGTEESTGTGAGPMSVQTIAFTILGVVLVVQAIPTLIEIAVTDTPGFAGFAPLRLAPSGGFFGSRGGAVAGEIVRLGLGVALIAGARPLAGALLRRDRQEPTGGQ